MYTGYGYIPGENIMIQAAFSGVMELVLGYACMAWCGVLLIRSTPASPVLLRIGTANA